MFFPLHTSLLNNKLFVIILFNSIINVLVLRYRSLLLYITGIIIFKVVNQSYRKKKNENFLTETSHKNYYHIGNRHNDINMEIFILYNINLNLKKLVKRKETERKKKVKIITP